jgi:hypothetical protein
MPFFLIRLSLYAAMLSALPLATLAQSSFRLVQPWLDTTGKPIQSHLGGILFDRGTYYWYGMDFRGKTLRPGTLPGVNLSWAYSKGVSVYSSHDLLHWKPLPNQLIPGSDPLLAPLNSVVRPKVLRNAHTGKYVMMVAITAPDFNSVNDVAYALADRPEGPFQFKGKLGWCGPFAQPKPPNLTHLWAGPWQPGTGLRQFEQPWTASDPPQRIRASDIALFKDDDGKAFLVTARSRALLYELGPDYTCAARVEIMQNAEGEAPALFKDRGTYYLLTSRLTTYAPNQNTYFTSSSVHGPWLPRGPFPRGPREETTFDGQTTFVLPVQGKPHAFIFMADHFGAASDNVVHNFANATHIWLPLEVDPEKRTITVRWRDSWDLSVSSQPADFE